MIHIFPILAVIACVTIVSSFVTFSSLTLKGCGVPRNCKRHGLQSALYCVECVDEMKEENKILKEVGTLGTEI